jgi:AraC family transcriptional regulator
LITSLQIKIAMSEVQPLPIQSFQDDASAQLLAQPPLLNSYQLGWSNICLEQHLQPAWELPEISLTQHMLILYQPKETTRVKYDIAGQLNEITFHPSDYANHRIALMPANVSFASAWDKEIHSTIIYLEPNFVANVLADEINPDQVEILVEPKRADPLIFQLFQALTAELSLEQRNNRCYVETMATALAAHLLRYYSSRQYQLPDYRDGLSNLKLNQAIELINENLCDSLSLAAIADELSMSMYHFSRQFKQSTGMSPHQYLMQQRIERAKHLLRGSNLAIVQIALDCGFANQSHFARYFRQATGISPRQFRQR